MPLKIIGFETLGPDQNLIAYGGIVLSDGEKTYSRSDASDTYEWKSQYDFLKIEPLSLLGESESDIIFAPHPMLAELDSEISQDLAGKKYWNWRYLLRVAPEKVGGKWLSRLIQDHDDGEIEYQWTESDRKDGDVKWDYYLFPFWEGLQKCCKSIGRQLRLQAAEIIKAADKFDDAWVIKKIK